MISAHYDEETGVVCTLANGIATIEAFDAYAPECQILLARSRSRHGRSLHLVDARDNPIQVKDNFDHMTRIAQGSVQADDRCAVILHSALARMQIGRMPDSFTRQFFSDRDSAMAWLLSQTVAAGARAGA